MVAWAVLGLLRNPLLWHHNGVCRGVQGNPRHCGTLWLRVMCWIVNYREI